MHSGTQNGEIAYDGVKSPFTYQEGEISVIERLGVEHIEEILSLQMECMDNNDLFLPTSREGYLRTFQYSNFCYGYRDGERLIAFLNCSIPTAQAQINFGRGRIKPEALNQVGHMNTLLVAKDVRKKGVGRELVEASLMEFLLRDCRYIYVLVRADNLGSVRLLQSMGFLVVDIATIQGQARMVFYRDLLEHSDGVL